jgi:hypothetical protein
MVVEKVETGNKMEDYNDPVSVYTYSKNDNGVLEEVKMFLDREEVKALRDFFDQILNLKEQAHKAVDTWKNTKIQNYTTMVQKIENNRIKSVLFEKYHPNKTVTRMLVEKASSGEEFVQEDKENPVFFNVYTMDNKEITDDNSLFLDREEAATLRDFINQILKETEGV